MDVCPSQPLPPAGTRPKALQDRIFQKLFDQAEIAKYSAKERQKYEESRKDYWDYYSTVTTAEKKGRAEGIETTNRENARKMKAKGYAISDIAEITGLTEDEINKL